MSFLNETTKDYGLMQGKEYNTKQYNAIGMQSSFNLDLLEETTSPDLGSIVEGLENIGINKDNDEVVQQMKDLENDFNAKLAEYTELYRQYLNQLSQQDELIQQNRGKNVFNNGTFNYVNKFGYTRSYTQDAWGKRDKSCPNVAPNETTQTIYDKLQHGEHMGTGEPCGLEGTNVRNESDGKIYWLGHDGRIRLYPNERTMELAQKNGGCPSGYTTLSNNIITTMSVGLPMNSKSNCNYIQENGDLWRRITGLNAQLLNISNIMYNNAQKLSEKDDTVDKQLESTRTQLASRISALNDERAKFEKVHQSVDTLTAEFNDTQLGVTREYTHYLVWTISAITLGALAMKYMMQ